MRLLRPLPFRRSELLFALLLTIGCFGAAGLVHAKGGGQIANWLALITLEIFLPLGLGLVSAGLLAGDPALDLLLSAHCPAWQLLGRRFLFVGGAGALLGSAGLLLAARWGLALPIESAAQVFIWLSPLVFCMGLSSAVALLRGKMLDGALATLGVMGMSLMLLPQIPRLCAGNPPGAACAAWLASPIMTLGNAADTYWPLNRLLWLAVGAALLVLSLKLTRREEALLDETSRE